MPRDRAGTFACDVLPQHARRLDGFADMVVSLYAKGMTTGEITAHLEEVYGTTISKDTISADHRRRPTTTSPRGRPDRWTGCTRCC